MISLQHIVFYVFSAIMVGSGIMVISSRNTVRGVLFLILAFFCSAVLWMLLQAEFLALALLFVYVGAVMTLFLFVVMMLNLKGPSLKEGFVRYLPVGIMLFALLVGMMMYVVGTKHFGLAYAKPIMHPANYSNVKELGRLLYTQYAYPFELAAVLLLVAIISAISLTFRGRQSTSKGQVVRDQIDIKRSDRIKVVKKI